METFRCVLIDTNEKLYLLGLWYQNDALKIIMSTNLQNWSLNDGVNKYHVTWENYQKVLQAKDYFDVFFNMKI